MQLKSLFLFLMMSLQILLFSGAGRAESEPVTDPFAKGIQSLQTKDPKTAMDLFREALSQHPGDTAVLTNLGIASLEAGQKGWAIAYLREALTLGSNLRETRQALEFSLSQLQIKEIPHEIEFWEKLRENVLVGISLPGLLLINAVALLLCGLVWIGYLKDRKAALENETAYAPLRIIHWAASLALFVSLTLVICKILDLSEVRGTIVAEKVQAFSAPSKEAPGLFEIYEGLEVLVQRAQGEWLQIRYPGGPTGWVPVEQVHITQSKDLIGSGK